MGLGRTWGAGYCDEYEHVARAMNRARSEDTKALQEFVHRLETTDETLLDTQAATLMKGQWGGASDSYDTKRIDANWYGRGGPSMWKRTARQRPSEIEAIVRRGRLELARHLLSDAERCEILGQCGHDECEIWITWPDGEASKKDEHPTVKMWVFVPDNSAYGDGRYCAGSKLTDEQQRLVDELRAEIDRVGPDHVDLPSSGPYGDSYPGDGLAGRIVDAATRLPAGYPIYRELGLSHPGGEPPEGEVMVAEPVLDHEPDPAQRGAESRERPSGAKVRIVRIRWVPSDDRRASGAEPAWTSRR